MEDSLIGVDFNENSLADIIGLLKNTPVVLQDKSIKIKLKNDVLILKHGETLAIDDNCNYYVFDTKTDELKCSFYAEDVVGLDQSLPIYIAEVSE